MTAGLWTSLLTIVGIWMVTVVSPGPNFLATTQTALAGSRRAALLVVLGIGLGTTVWCVASLLGLGLLFERAAWLYLLVKLCGGLYLAFLGLRILLAARRQAVQPQAAPALRVSGWRAVRLGLLTDLSNPKAAAFFASLFAVTVPPEAPLWFDGAIVALVVAQAVAWYCLVACFMAAPPVAALYRRAQRAILALMGAAFIALGARLAVAREA